MDVSESEDPEGLRVFYYLVQDVKVPIAVSHVQSSSSLTFIVTVPRFLSHLPSLQDQAHLDLISRRSKFIFDQNKDALSRDG